MSRRAVGSSSTMATSSGRRPDWGFDEGGAVERGSPPSSSGTSSESRAAASSSPMVTEQIRPCPAHLYRADHSAPPQRERAVGHPRSPPRGASPPGRQPPVAQSPVAQSPPRPPLPPHRAPPHGASGGSAA